ncbi:MAG: hypothetical protein WC505_07335 [Patescibacteria group bacterium]
MLTKEQVEILAREFDPKDLEIRVGSKLKKEAGYVLLTYVTKEAVERRLNEVDLNWMYSQGQAYILNGKICIDAQLSILGVVRAASACPLKDDAESENAAYRDDIMDVSARAFKRAAAMFGVGSYLYASENLIIKPAYCSSSEYTAIEKGWKTYEEVMRILGRHVTPSVTNSGSPINPPKPLDSPPPAAQESFTEIDAPFSSPHEGPVLVYQGPIPPTRDDMVMLATVWLSRLFGSPTSLNANSLVSLCCEFTGKEGKKVSVGYSALMEPKREKWLESSFANIAYSCLEKFIKSGTPIADIPYKNFFADGLDFRRIDKDKFDQDEAKEIIAKYRNEIDADKLPF